MSTLLNERYYDASGTIAVAGMAQQALPQNFGRCFLFLQNISSGDLWVNYGVNTVAQIGVPGNIRMPPGSILLEDGNFVSTEPISIIGAASGQGYTLKYGQEVQP
jgi:hypothetical protein